jgi:hypothetical protein
VTVAYDGAWNGSYSYGDEALENGQNSCGDCKIVSATWSGVGSKNASFLFPDHYCGDGFFVSLTIQKDDSSIALLNVSANVLGFPTYSDSTTSPFASAAVDFQVEC